jgi:hypothetical protein
VSGLGVDGDGSGKRRDRHAPVVLLNRQNVEPLRVGGMTPIAGCVPAKSDGNWRLREEVDRQALSRSEKKPQTLAHVSSTA